MRPFRFAISFVATTCLLMLWSGCAYMNSGSLDELVPEPIHQLTGDDDLLADLKLDPLSDTMSATDAADSAAATASNDGFFKPASNQSDGPEFPVGTDFPVDPKSESMVSIEDATPIRDPDDVTPIILKAINRAEDNSSPTSPEQPMQEFTVEELPMLPVDQSLKTTNKPESLPVLDATVERTVEQREPANPSQASGRNLNAQVSEPLTPAVTQSSRLLPMPANENNGQFNQDPNSTSQTDNSFVAESNDEPTEADFEAFVSDQMEFSLPPFAMHPDDNAMNVEDGFFEPNASDGHSVTQGTAATEPDSMPNELVSKQGVSNESLQIADDHETAPMETESNFFVGNRIETDEVLAELPPFETQSAELPAEPIATVAANDPKTDFVTAPASESASGEKITWQGQLDRTIEIFEDQIHETDDDVEAESLESGLSILRALRRRMQPDNDSPEEIRRYWTHQIQAINDLLSNSNRSDSRVAAVALEELRLAVHNLQVIADLKIFNAVICKSVSGFGQYEPFESKEFVARQTILVYCEIDNFAPLLETMHGRTSYQTRLSSSFTIRSLEGDVVQHQDYPVVTDSARNLRRDFFMHLPITFGELEPGIYELQITVRDHGSDKTAELDRSLKLTIR